MKKFMTMAAVAVTLMPSVAYAKSICPFTDAKSTKCEIPLCLLRGGMGTEADCNPALVKMIVRAIFQKPPVPLPPKECNCSWIKPLVIPADQYGIPLFADVDTDFMSSIGINLDPGQALTSFSFNNAQRQAIFDKAMSLENDYFSTCTDEFKRSKRDMKCFIQTGGERIDIDVDHKKYRRGWKRRHQYIYSIKTTTPEGIVSETKLKLRHKTVSYCRTYINGIQTSDDNCNANGLLPNSLDDDPSFFEEDIPIPPIPTDPLPSEPTTPTDTLDKIPAEQPVDDGIMVFQ